MDILYANPKRKVMASILGEEEKKEIESTPV
jgi:hypothetical protein